MYIAAVKKFVAILIFCCSFAASAQVKIDVPEHNYKARDKIDVTISNLGKTEITFCVEYGYMSYADSGHSEFTPTPVYVEQKGPRRWGSLITGPDVGSIPHPETLGEGQSRWFPFRVNAHGTVRIGLQYRLGSDPHFCDDRKGARIARSRAFPIE